MRVRGGTWLDIDTGGGRLHEYCVCLSVCLFVYAFVICTCIFCTLEHLQVEIRLCNCTHTHACQYICACMHTERCHFHHVNHMTIYMHTQCRSLSNHAHIHACIITYIHTYIHTSCSKLITNDTCKYVQPNLSLCENTGDVNMYVYVHASICVCKCTS